MDFAYDDRTQDLRERLLAFMDQYVYPAEPVFTEVLRPVVVSEIHGAQPPIQSANSLSTHQ